MPGISLIEREYAMRIFSFVLCFLSAAPPLFAAQSSTTKSKTLPEVKVTAAAVKRSVTIPTLGSALEAVGRVPGGASIVSAEDYQTARSSTLQDVLAYAPGVYAKSRFGAEEARLSIRGSGIQRTFHLRGVKLLQDGVPINQADGAGDFQAVEPLALQYTEVFRGANALQYGGTNLGGAVNFVSPTGYDAPLVQGRFEAGSFSYFRTQVSSGAVVGPADYYVSLSHFFQDGFRNHANQDTKRLYSNYGLRLTDSLETRFYVSAVNSRSRLPGSLTKAQMLQNPAQNALANATQNQKRDFDLVRIANKTTLLGDDQRVEFGSFFIRKDLHHPISPIVDDVSDDFGFSSRYLNEKDLAGRKNRFLIGFSPVFGMISATRSTNVNGGYGAQTAQTRQRAYNLDLFLEEQFYVFPQIALVSGLQYSYASRAIYDRFTSDGDHSGHPTYKQVSPKLGLLYDLTETSQLYTNFSRSFEPPSFAELSSVTTGGIRDINAQEGSAVEFGTRGQGGRFSWDTSWYYSWVENELLGLNDGNGVSLGTINAGRTRHQGIESGFSLDLLRGILPEDKLTLRGAYNWNHFHLHGDSVYGNNQLPGLPEHFMRTELLYQHPSGIYAGPNLEWSFAEAPVDMANTLFADGYTTVGIKGGYRTKRGISFFVEGRNLTHEIYANTTGVTADARGRDSAQFLPGDSRSVYAGVEVRWG